MKDRRFLMLFAIGIVVIAAAVAGILYMQRGSHVVLEGRFLKVRTAPLDDNSAVAVIDFRCTNPSNFPFMVRNVNVSMQDNSGATLEGSVVSEADTARLFAGVPLLGQKYNTTLIMRDRIAPRASQDRMVAVRFDVPESQLEKRKGLVIRVDEVDGLTSEIPEK